jgi:hypothetical protein
VYEEVFGCGFALVGQNLIMQIKDSGRDNVSNTARSPPCPPAIRICRRSGWELQARVALAESDLHGARASIQNALAIIDRFEILFAAWQTFATASQVCKHAKEVKTAGAYRDRAEFCIPKIADSFEPNEPLRATFLATTPVRRILCERVVNKAKRQHGSRRVAAP